jgi:prevent-host-death family protein
MVRVEATKARAEFAELINTVRYGGGRRLIVRRGKEMAGLVPPEDLLLLEALEDQLDIDAARRALADPRNKTRIPLDHIKKRLGR